MTTKRILSSSKRAISGFLFLFFLPAIKLKAHSIDEWKNLREYPKLAVNDGVSVKEESRKKTWTFIEIRVTFHTRKHAKEAVQHDYKVYG